MLLHGMYAVQWRSLQKSGLTYKVLFREKVKRKDEESGEKDLKRRKEIIVFIQSIFL